MNVFRKYPVIENQRLHSLIRVSFIQHVVIADESVARGFQWDFPWHVAMQWINDAKQSHLLFVCLNWLTVNVSCVNACVLSDKPLWSTMRYYVSWRVSQFDSFQWFESFESVTQKIHPVTLSTGYIASRWPQVWIRNSIVLLFLTISSFHNDMKYASYYEFILCVSESLNRFFRNTESFTIVL